MGEQPLGPLMVDLAGTSLTSEERELLRQPAIGSVILFRRNYSSKAQVSDLVGEIKALRSPSLLVAVDQEGGRVQRFAEGFYALPAIGELGKFYDHDPEQAISLAETAGRLMSVEVLQTGVDFSFAPVLDCQQSQSAVIGDRAFHHEPDIICKLAGAYINGMHRAGMAATGKHFPGHGGVSGDSHHELPLDPRPFSEIDKRDLKPFAKLASRLQGVMTAHVLYQSVDAKPPAYSSHWLRQILRHQLKFTGTIFSDDLSMAGAEIAGDMFTRSISAIDAGCDVILICNAPESARAVTGQINDYGVGDQNRLLAMKGDPAVSTKAGQLEQLAANLQNAGLEIG